MPYTRRTWQNAPSSATPVTAAALNNIEDGVEEAVEAVTGRLSEANLETAIGAQIDTALEAYTPGGLGIIYAGSDPDTARTDPVEASKIWIVSDAAIVPTALVAGDLIFVSTEVPVEPTVSWLHAYFASDIALAGGSAVDTWADSAGSLDLVQATSGRRPTFIAAADPNPAQVDFNRESTSTGDSLYTAATTLNQPGCIVIVYRLDTLPENNSNNNTRRRLFGGIDTTNAWTYAIGHSGTAANYRLAIGSDVGTGGTATTGWHVAVLTFYANECELRIDGATVTLSPSVTNTTYAGGFTVGANAAMTSELFDGAIERMLVIDSIPVNLLDYEGYLLSLIENWT